MSNSSLSWNFNLKVVTCTKWIGPSLYILFYVPPKLPLLINMNCWQKRAGNLNYKKEGYIIIF